MAKLNQILAVEKRVKTEGEGTLTRAYHDAAKTQLLAGLSRTYTPRDDDGDKFPAESTRVQLRISALVRDVVVALTRYYDLTMSKDHTNTKAKANIVVDDQILVENVPVTFLLFLEKHLQDIATFVGKLPVLDPADEWTYRADVDAYTTPAAETFKTKKVPRNHVLAEATDKHPAQVNVFTEDVVIGTWSTVRFSGALPQQTATLYKERIGKLLDAVKKAREEANATTVEDREIGDAIFGYLFG